ncbi:MAG: class II fructose-bisphosphate aldolase [Candidatus Magasanikbacteria bacterium]
MSNPLYKGIQSPEELRSLVATVCSLDGDSVASIIDEEVLKNEFIYTLQFNASVNENEEVKHAAQQWIFAIADAMNITSGSNHEFYLEKQQGKHQFFTVPAVNSRMVTFHTIRAALRSAEALEIPHIIFELALSEVGYTGQQKDEYAALVKAAYISLGLSERTVYLQADHYQLDPKKYAEDADAEMKRIQDAITFALEHGVYNIDIDSSKFETANSNKTDRENQAENARLTATLLHFIRNYESEHELPCTVSVGGEVGEVGGENTRYPQVNAYLELIKEEMERLGSDQFVGLDKVSINVGSAHGGVLGPDGQPLDSIPLDFTAHHDLYMMAKDPMSEREHVISVQHGASTLPKHYFPLFPAMHVAEIHLATGFQNVVWETLEKKDTQLFETMKSEVMNRCGEKVAAHETEAIGFMKERKRVTEFFKRDLLLSNSIEAIEQALENEFAEIFHSLYTLLLPKRGIQVSEERED